MENLAKVRFECLPSCFEYSFPFCDRVSESGTERVLVGAWRTWSTEDVERFLVEYENVRVQSLEHIVQGMIFLKRRLVVYKAGKNASNFFVRIE